MKKPQTATQYLLRALFPYSREGLLLAFKPSQFFYELSRASGYSAPTLRATYNRAKRADLITVMPTADNEIVPRLTAKGHLRAAPFVSEKLTHSGKLLVIFDIPEARSLTRNSFRRLLKSLDFRQVQQSVWVTDYDHRAVIIEAIEELKLAGYVEFYEAARLFPT